MKATLIARSIHSQLLRLYPRVFRDEFEAEMQSVFATALAEAAAGGQLGVFLLRELSDAPRSIAHAHWHAYITRESHQEAVGMTEIDRHQLIAIYEKPGWSFYLLWVLLTLLCLPIAFFLDLLNMRLITLFVGDYIYVDGVRHITEDYLGLYTVIPVAGLVTGILQYGLLRRNLPHMGGWVAATTGGWLLGVFLTLIPGWLDWKNPLLTVDLAFIVMGLSIGLGQWLLLRRRLPRAGWWIAANIAGWGLLALTTNGNAIGQLGLFAFGFFPACATALALALLMKQVQPTRPLGA